MCVVEDDIPVQQSLKLLLKSHGIETRTYPSAEKFLEERETNGCRCLLLDFSLPGMNGLELQKTLHERCDKTPVIFISGHGDIPTAVNAVKSGAIDFLPKPFSDEELIKRIQEAFKRFNETHQRETEISENLVRLQSLTKREKEILDLVVQGLSSKEIAQLLSLSHRTVETHRTRIMSKMDTRSLPDLVARVLSCQTAESTL